jgi:hypothetical protein
MRPPNTALEPTAALVDPQFTAKVGQIISPGQSGLYSRREFLQPSC